MLMTFKRFEKASTTSVYF